MTASEHAAARALDLARELGRHADAEVVVTSTDHALTRFANSFIHQNVAESSTTVRLRLHLAGRTATGSASIGRPDGGPDASGDPLRALVERTVRAAELSPLDPHWPGLNGALPVPVAPPPDPATAGADPAERAERVRAFVAGAEGLDAAGYCSTVRLGLTYANSAGHLAQAVTAEAALDAIARDRGSDGVARLVSTRLAEIDGAVLGARAAMKARAGADPIELPPGRYEVVLEPTAVLDVLQMLAVFGFNGKAVAERRSFVELGSPQFDPAITLVDDPVGAGGAGIPFDVEGSPTPPLTLIDRGTSSAVTHDRRTAAAAGATSTGHALVESATRGAMATHLHLLSPAGPAPQEVPGPAADSSVAALVARVKRGLLVTDNWYTRVLDPRTLVVTGLTRNGLWLIEDGQVTRPVANLRFTQSYPQALAPGSVLGIGTHGVSLPSNWGVVTMRAPALHLASWNYTS